MRLGRLDSVFVWSLPRMNLEGIEDKAPTASPFSMPRFLAMFNMRILEKALGALVGSDMTSPKFALFLRCLPPANTFGAEETGSCRVRVAVSRLPVEGFV